MTITVSTIPTKTRSTYKSTSKPYRKLLRRACEKSFNDIGYRLGVRTDGKWVATPMFGRGLSDLTFDDIHFAKAWLVKAGAFKEVC